MRRLADPTYMGFPFRIDIQGAQIALRRDHVRQQIEQVLFTAVGERVFRPLFGAGVHKLIFEPNAAELWDATEQRLSAALAEALHGEVDPRSLAIKVDGRDNELHLVVSYRLATISQSEEHRFTLNGSDANG